MNSTDRRRGVAAGILLLAIGLSVRFPITSVSPLLNTIGDAFHLSASGLAAVSALPVLMFGLASPFAPALVNRLGLSRAITVLLGALAVATLVRPLSTPLLFAGVVVGGVAIAILGILAPQIIRQALPRRGGYWTGMYTTAFGVSAAAGAALAVPLLHMLGDNVVTALMAWAIPVLIAFGLALGLGPALGGPGARGHRTPTQPWSAILRTPGIWPVTGYFACQALIYFSLTAWLPTIAMDRGLSPRDAGLLLAWLSIAGLPASLLAPTLAARKRLRTPLIVSLAVLSVIGLLSLAFAPIGLAPVVVAFLGIAQSGAFGLAIALIVFTTPSAALTAGFSAVSQGLGYAFAALGPLLLGFLAQAGVPWAGALLVLAGVAGAQLCFGIWGSRASQRNQGG